MRPHGTQLLSFPQGAKIVKKKDIESRETSNGCRDARSSVRCVKGYSVVVLTGTDAQTVRPDSRYSSCFNGDGRTDCASLQPLLVLL